MDCEAFHTAAALVILAKNDQVLDRLRLDINHTQVNDVHFANLDAFKAFLFAKFAKATGLPADPYCVMGAIAHYIVDEETDGDLYTAVVDGNEVLLLSFMDKVQDYAEEYSHDLV